MGKKECAAEQTCKGYTLHDSGKCQLKDATCGYKDQINNLQNSKHYPLEGWYRYKYVCCEHATKQFTNRRKLGNKRRKIQMKFDNDINSIKIHKELYNINPDTQSKYNTNTAYSVQDKRILNIEQGYIA